MTASSPVTGAWPPSQFEASLQSPARFGFQLMAAAGQVAAAGPTEASSNNRVRRKRVMVSLCTSMRTGTASLACVPVYVDMRGWSSWRIGERIAE